MRAVLPSPWLSKSRRCLCFPIYIILSGGKEPILHVHSVLGPWAEMASGGLKVVFEKWMFFYQEHNATNSFENLISLQMEKNMWLLELRKTFLPTSFFQWKKQIWQIWQVCVDFSRTKTLLTFFPPDCQCSEKPLTYTALFLPLLS